MAMQADPMNSLQRWADHGRQRIVGMSVAGGVTGGGRWVRALGGPAVQRLVVFASLALVTVAALAALALVQGIDRQLADIEHTYEVRNQARELTIALSEAESNQRGFVLTRDESYLEPYRRAVAAIGTRTLSLVAVAAHDQEQADRVASIVAEIQGKTTEMERTVQLVNDQRSAEARSLIETGLGDRLMEQVRVTLETFIADENRELLARNRSIDNARHWLVGAIVAALAGAVLLAYALFMRTRLEVSELARSTSALASENDKLEAHVLERTRAVEEARLHAERERERVEALLQDANHRIGNSLATVSSLLGLQVLRSRSTEVRQALEAARLRVHAIASAHRRLRLGKDLETASASDFIEAVVEDIAATLGESNKVVLHSQVSPITVSARDATTLGILVGELVTNALKHAFPPGRAGKICVVLIRDETGAPMLTVTDNGVGPPPDAQDQGDGGLGSVIVKQLARQFGGKPTYATPPGGGLEVRVPLPGIEPAAAPPT